MLNAKDILGSDDIQKEKVEVPEWNGFVFVRGMNGSERDKFELGVLEFQQKGNQAAMQNLRAKVAAWCICDENGKHLFSEKDIAELGKKNAKALDRIFEAAQRLSGVGTETEKAIDDAEKN